MFYNKEFEIQTLIIKHVLSGDPRMFLVQQITSEIIPKHNPEAPLKHQWKYTEHYWSWLEASLYKILLSRAECRLHFSSAILQHPLSFLETSQSFDHHCTGIETPLKHTWSILFGLCIILKVGYPRTHWQCFFKPLVYVKIITYNTLPLIVKQRTEYKKIENYFLYAILFALKNLLTFPLYILKDH